ncbi:MAG: hypothetical protein MAG431_02505 [Chloroflexi bacterium]|nr:hypothetical protein [Chloroflexota bacterium]
MPKIATTKMSSRGQVVIPEKIRRELNLKKGAQFVVMGDKNVVILKNISPPSMQEFDSLIAKAREAGRQAGLEEIDIQESINKVREKK